MSRKCSPGEDQKEGKKTDKAKALTVDAEKPGADQEKDPEQDQQPDAGGDSDSPEKQDEGGGS